MESIGAQPCVSDRMAFRWEWQGHEMNLLQRQASSEAIQAEFEDRLAAYFGRDRVTGGEETSYVLGMRIDRDWEKQTVKISQGAFARKFLENCGVEESRRVARSPLPDGCELRKWDGEAVDAETFDYLPDVWSWGACSAVDGVYHPAGFGAGDGDVGAVLQ